MIKLKVNYDDKANLTIILFLLNHQQNFPNFAVHNFSVCCCFQTKGNFIGRCYSFRSTAPIIIIISDRLKSKHIFIIIEVKFK